MKFVILVEGKTERSVLAQFLKQWIDPRLEQPVGIQLVTFDGYADLVGKLTVKTRMHLEGPKSDEIIAVLGLLDLYGPNFYPTDKTTADERYVWAKAHFEDEIRHSKFRMFFAVHEIEAWLFSDPTIFPQAIRKALPKSIAHPERVNFDEPPAKLLDRIYMKQTKRHYKKTTHGKQLFEKLDPKTAAEKCPYLHEMLRGMLELAKAAGQFTGGVGVTSAAPARGRRPERF